MCLLILTILLIVKLSICVRPKQVYMFTVHRGTQHVARRALTTFVHHRYTWSTCECVCVIYPRLSKSSFFSYLLKTSQNKMHFIFPVLLFIHTRARASLPFYNGKRITVIKLPLCNVDSPCLVVVRVYAIHGRYLAEFKVDKIDVWLFSHSKKTLLLKMISDFLCARVIFMRV